ncbi:MAG TPA: WXG100 family type VII secretion target [Candidatus Dormibacteraeota bacterium]|nr:WXG100 family type VII secretion target [Candidatus Dormibacteraeota bacterium]
MSIIQFNPGAMDAAVADVRRTHANLQARFAELQSHVNQIAGAWDGATQALYLGIQQTWNQFNQQHHEALNSFGLGVGIAHENLAQADARNAAGWSGGGAGGGRTSVR